MNLLRYIVFLGILNIVFGFVWKWIFVLPCALVFTLLKLNKAMIFVKAFGAYLLVSITALLTLGAIHDNPGLFSVISYPLLGGFVLYMSVAQNTYEGQKQAMMTGDYELLDNLKYDGILIIGTLVLFIITLFIPIIAYNPLTLGLMGIIAWAYELPVIGWLLGIGGVFFLLSIIWYGFIFSMMLFGAIVSKFGKKPNIDIKVEKKEEVIDAQITDIDSGHEETKEQDEDEPVY